MLVRPQYQIPKQTSYKKAASLKNKDFFWLYNMMLSPLFVLSERSPPLEASVPITPTSKLEPECPSSAIFLFMNTHGDTSRVNVY